jgi:hypothetical protein
MSLKINQIQEISQEREELLLIKRKCISLSTSLSVVEEVPSIRLAPSTIAVPLA